MRRRVLWSVVLHFEQISAFFGSAIVLLTGSFMMRPNLNESGDVMSWKLIDLFCGAGGMSYGFVDKAFCGAFECVAAVDFDEASIRTHSANIPGPSFAMTVDDWLRDHEVPLADVVIGGPPCQGFSLLNKNRTGTNDERCGSPSLKLSNARVHPYS